jgi:hypothetical protein
LRRRFGIGKRLSGAFRYNAPTSIGAGNPRGDLTRTNPGLARASARQSLRPYALMLFSPTTWPQMLTCLAKTVEKSLGVGEQ